MGQKVGPNPASQERSGCGGDGDGDGDGEAMGGPRSKATKLRIRTRFLRQKPGGWALQTVRRFAVRVETLTNAAPFVPDVGHTMQRPWCRLSFTCAGAKRLLLEVQWRRFVWRMGELYNCTFTKADFV